MVTFKNMGRLGNFLFQAATAYAYAQKHGLDFAVPSTTNDPYWNPLYLQNLAKKLPKLRNYDIIEKQHQYKPLPFFEHYRDHNITLQGYFQSEKYFKDVDIIKLFNYPWNPHNNVSIHVRRGDYLKYPHKHPVVPDRFYIDAIHHFYHLGFTDFYVYSDDRPYVINYFSNSVLFSGCKFHFPQYTYGKTVEENDLMGIANCAGGHINSSSTFAWWGAWLNQNPNKIIITPKLWFVPGHGGLNTDDIIPESWMKM